MTQPDDWQDTQQLDPNQAPPALAKRPADAGAEAVEPFPDTELLVDTEHDTRWWPEAIDGRWGENAAEFAASQPTPLTIV